MAGSKSRSNGIIAVVIAVIIAGGKGHVKGHGKGRDNGHRNGHGKGRDNGHGKDRSITGLFNTLFPSDRDVISGNMDLNSPVIRTLYYD